MASPLHQFSIEKLTSDIVIGGLDITPTNSTLWMFVAIIVSTIGLLYGIRKQDLVPSKGQSLVEMIHGFVHNTFFENLPASAKAYFPTIFTIFIFILGCNLSGMLPYSFTVTSHLAVTLTMALAVLLAVVIIGIKKQGLHFFDIFIPKGLPMWITPIVSVIEIISFFARPVSHSIRLAANMTAGHVLMKVIAGFVFSMGATLGLLPVLFLTALTGFEIFVAVLHAYIFTLLSCIYLKDALEAH
jgi:F-type H+-transporting ATPase subunit a